MLSIISWGQFQYFAPPKKERRNRMKERGRRRKKERKLERKEGRKEGREREKEPTIKNYNSIVVVPVWQLLKTVKIELPYDPAIHLLGTYLKNSKTLIQKDICTLLFIVALFTVAKTWKQPK